MNFLRQLFNLSPGPDIPFITDNRERKYWLLVLADDNGPYRLQLVYRGKCVGYANLVWDLPIELTFGDLFIVPSHRKRGLGTAFLREVIALAQQRGVEVIRGFAVQKDVQETPNLLAWYQRHGFEVVPVNDGNKVARLSLKLTEE
jgi:GNAT superfamily N-acetyltransferase